MSNFNMDSFVAFLSNKKGGGGASNESKERSSLPKLRYFKAKEGEINIRWLPYVNPENHAPAFTVYYYDNPAVFGERRVVAPFQFGLPDPIAEYIQEKRSSGKRLPTEDFKNLMKLSPKLSFYIPLLERGNEGEKALLWELNEKRFKDMALVTVAHPDYRDEVIFDPKNGRDIIISGKYGDKFFNGNRVLEWSPTLRGKSTPLAKKEEDMQDILDSIQDPVAYNRQYLRKTEYYENLLSTALAYFSNGGKHVEENGAGTSRGSDSGSKAASTSSSRDEVENALESAFEDDDLF